MFPFFPSFAKKISPIVTRAFQWLTLFVLMLTVLPARAQSFIGCRTDDGNDWEETPMLRTNFHLSEKKIQLGNIHLTVTSLGYHEVYVNGQKVGDRVLQPAVSQLNKRSHNVHYDITPYVHEGDNELLLWIGQGWGRVYDTPAAVSARVFCPWEDSTMRAVSSMPNMIVATDSTWQASPSGYRYTGSWQPLQFGGERYDARVQPDWRPATVFKKNDYRSKNQTFKGNRIIDTLMPVSVTRTNDSTLLLDFGRVLTGWFQADFQPMPAGHEVSMEYLDHLHATPPHTESDYYVSAGSGRDHFTNRFHYHAFRYVRVTGGDIKTARALQISALNPDEAATFECSDPRLNAIHDLVQYTLQCLTLNGYMMDCPHLERMGYGGDGNSSTMTLMSMYDVSDTYYNWIEAWGDAMDSTGSLPYVAPAFPTGGGPYWSGFIIKAPWRFYLNYGIPGSPWIDGGFYGPMYNYYGQMKKWLDYVKRYSPNGLLEPWPDEGRMWFLGDWLTPDGVDVGGESALFVSNCFIADCLVDMERMAQVLGYPDDVRTFAQWRKQLKTNIHQKFYHPETHTYANGTPLDQSYALLMDIAPDSSIRTAVKERLLADCHDKYHDHIAVGLMGVPIFTEWCIRERQANLMATILRQPDYPGYLHMINHGATTTWESWGCERDNGETVVEDRSRVHNCYNGVGIWFYQALAGIRPDPEQAGYKHFFIDPQPCEGINWVRSTKPTQYGTIRVEIHYQPASITSGDSGDSSIKHSSTSTLKLSVPEGTTATLFSGTPQERTVKAGEWEFEMP